MITSALRGYSDGVAAVFAAALTVAQVKDIGDHPRQCRSLVQQKDWVQRSHVVEALQVADTYPEWYAVGKSTARPHSSGVLSQVADS